LIRRGSDGSSSQDHADGAFAGSASAGGEQI
jgi:hypothetical protein